MTRDGEFSSRGLFSGLASIGGTRAETKGVGRNLALRTHVHIFIWTNATPGGRMSPNDAPSTTPFPLDDALLARPVEGRHLAPGPLAAQLRPGPTLLLFLRHFG